MEQEIPPYLDLNGAAKEENGEANKEKPKALLPLRDLCKTSRFGSLLFRDPNATNVSKFHVFFEMILADFSMDFMDSTRKHQ